MKRALLISLSCLSVLVVQAQKSYDYGIFLGGTEQHNTIIPRVIQISADNLIHPFNPQEQLSPAAGGYYRYSLNSRYSLRGGVNVWFNPSKSYMPGLVDGYGLFEFNFHQLSPKRDKHLISSYIAVGLSYEYNFVTQNAINSLSSASIPATTTLSKIRSESLWRGLKVPFNVGVRYNVTPSLTMGLEWIIRRGYELDYTTDAGSPYKNFLMSNWRSFFGVTVGYMVGNYCKTCPFYDNERKKLK